MSDFDPDAYYQQAPSQLQQGFDPDHYYANASTPAAPTGPPSPFKPDDPAIREEDLPLQSGGPISYGVGLANSWLGEELARGAHAIGVTDPASLRDVSNIPAALETFFGARLGKRTGAPQIGTGEDAAALQAQLNKRALNSPQSMGAASSAPQLSRASPELQQAILDAARRNGGAINVRATNAQIQADSLPVPMRLSEGQALEDPQLISMEQNRRGMDKTTINNLNQQNQALTQNLQAIRDQVGPDVFSGNHVEHGDTIIQAYKDKAAAADADTASKYNALRDANGGQWPVDINLLKTNVDQALHDRLLYEHAPSAEMSQLQKFQASGRMSMEQYEAMRTNLASIARSSSDGNERAAAGVIRQQMEDLPMGPASPYRDLADTARAAARNQFAALENDPAYKAAVNDSVAPDRFIQKFVINGNRDDLATMRQNLAGNDAAQQTISVAALDHLRDQAGVTGGTGNFGAAKFNKAWQALQPKVNQLFSPDTQETLQNLADTARRTTQQPRGSYVNNSNTLTAAMGEHAAGLAEHGANAVAHGFPVGTITRKLMQGRSISKASKQAWSTGAGIDRIDVP